MTLRHRVSIVGPLPPPVHGAAEVTRMVADALEEVVAVERLSIAPGEGTRGLRYHMSRVARVLLAARKLASGIGPVYLSAAGGFGLGYNALLAAVARCFGRPLFVHHHSFAYLDRRDRVAALLMKAAGQDATHICLCPRMAARLNECYGRRRTLILSNAAFCAPAGGDLTRRSDRPIRLGHFGNLSLEKGLDLVVAVAVALHEQGIDAELVLAGPVATTGARSVLTAARRRLGARLIELGPLYDADRELFFAAADVFVFPTRYANEAEPLVVFEALAHGIPVIAFDRGCIAEQIEEAGLIVRTGGAFVALATAAIAAWARSPDSLERARSHAHTHMTALHASSRCQLDFLLERIESA